MTYGIDLGTTYSLIGSGDELFSGLVSSSVDLNKKQQCDRHAVGSQIKSGYKVDMTIGKSGELPIKCSTIILKELAKQAEAKTGEPVRDVIISVPAKFAHTQRLAVIEAGKNAGLEVKGVINEPTAAAVYCCMDKPGLYLVYDLGGGTFDVSIVSVDNSGIRVLCTDGLSNLAGNDFDRAVLNRIFAQHKIPVRYKSEVAIQEALASIQQAKEDFQKDGITKEISLSPFHMAGNYLLTKEEYIEAMKVFNPTITLCKALLASLMDIEKPELLFVGGSTACPHLRKWVAKELQLDIIEHDVQPDMLVAKGVAKYAWLNQNGYSIVQDVTKQLSIADSRGIAQPIIFQDTPVPATGELLLTNPTEASYMEFDLYQGDDCIATKNDYIGTLSFEFGEMIPEGAGVVNVVITVDVNGIVNLTGMDLRTGQTQSIQLKVR